MYKKNKTQKKKKILALLKKEQIIKINLKNNKKIINKKTKTTKMTMMMVMIKNKMNKKCKDLKQMIIKKRLLRKNKIRRIAKIKSSRETAGSINQNCEIVKKIPKSKVNRN